jgi:hypothetical protein
MIFVAIAIAPPRTKIDDKKRGPPRLGGPSLGYLLWMGLLRRCPQSPCTASVVLVISPPVSPTRLTNPTSLVRPLRVRLITTTRLTRRRMLTSNATTNKETDVKTPVRRRRVLVVAVMHIHMEDMDMKNGIRLVLP